MPASQVLVMHACRLRGRTNQLRSRPQRGRSTDRSLGPSKVASCQSPLPYCEGNHPSASQWICDQRLPGGVPGIEGPLRAGRDDVLSSSACLTRITVRSRKIVSMLGWCRRTADLTNPSGVPICNFSSCLLPTEGPFSIPKIAPPALRTTSPNWRSASAKVVMHLASFQSPKARRVGGRLITPADIAVTVTGAYTRHLPHSNTCLARASSSIASAESSLSAAAASPAPEVEICVASCEGSSSSKAAGGTPRGPHRTLVDISLLSGQDNSAPTRACAELLGIIQARCAIDWTRDR